ncbi:RAQPRD family integrative conjugative element protein [Pseudomonas monteilii]|uniref:integrative conjugative element protein, RAQPRD family n=1 Tax=Pseudomonas monteilii TaxID=76759 RepID=UPI003800487B
MNTSTSALLLTSVVSLGAVAQDAPEHSELGLMQRQIAAIQLLADRASSSSVDAAGARYRFDYPMFTADLERVRQGIHKYLSPSRAQPAEMVELTGDYRTEASVARPSHEHD